MAWIVDEPKTQKELAKSFKELMQADEILQIPGAHDAMAALVAQQTGFSALYLSGGAYTASKGLPDLGIVTSTEVAERARDLVRATNLPVLVDIDTGFGGVLNVARTAREMLEANVAAVQIEDQQLPKKCGHLNGKQLVTKEEMEQKLQAIKKVAPSLVIVARTDARANEGLDAAIERANAYVAAGADAIFPEALQTDEEFQVFAQKVQAPLLANMTEFGKTPYISAEEFQRMGFHMVIYPVTSLRVAAKAYERIFKLIKEEGTQKNGVTDMQTRKELYETISYDDFEALDKNIAKTVLGQ
ncbi:methylisocitrate lyase [Virgibacillus pantothenticus]|uniref:methylisocitrate lyase n=1 Tax=Virgibacillus pantothenticus TaxID=1473 RepID=UPI001C2429ED|nr:methylisocitrate lyase [Virgibacillus pantothenticus]MBU8567204.1 methylisocitrate lyase [Virgibacillus pantothenticus]MBU8599961.1 methylisocitrate lyase [Virgibacillus pantothenticus]MBU8635458.1 methylisocitrate lyase [Virgibacillus pantothenticus]MBU8642255.1 methylisocitrate lyase [Virgibacillus pantothenticus]MBU8646306.1 methylisocitrate lyase [Virgibacillus pantothenticus]